MEGNSSNRTSKFPAMFPRPTPGSRSNAAPGLLAVSNQIPIDQVRRLTPKREGLAVQPGALFPPDEACLADIDSRPS